MISCTYCQKDIDSISSYCSNQDCRKFLLRNKWIVFTLLFISLGVISFFLVEKEYIRSASLYFEVLFFLHLWFILRNYKSIFISFLIYNIIVFLVLFTETFNFHVKYLNENNIGFIVLGLIIYLVAYFWYYYDNVRKSLNIGFIKGISVLSLFLTLAFVLLIGLDILSKYFSDKIISILINRLHLRLVLILITLLITCIVAFIASLKMGINKAEDLISQELIKERVFDRLNKKVHSYQGITIITPILEVIEKFIILIINFFIEIINNLKKFIEILIKLLTNLVIELMKVMKEQGILFVKSVYVFVMMMIVPVAIMTVIGIHLIKLPNEIIAYTRDASISNIFSIIGSILIIQATTILLIVGRGKNIYQYVINEEEGKFFNREVIWDGLKSINDNVLMFETTILFALYIGIILISYISYLLSKFLEMEYFNKIGNATIVGTATILMIALMAILWIIFYRGDKKRDFISP